MTNPVDFDLSAGLRARALVSHVPPNALLEKEGDDVALDRAEARQGLPAELRPGGRYDGVAVEKRVVGRVAPPRRRSASRSTKEQLYNQAKRLNIKGRSSMTKAQLEQALSRARS